MEQMQRYNQRLVEELKNKQTQERVRLPKIQRSEAKTRMAMFKKSLRITATAAITPEMERERIKQVLWTDVRSVHHNNCHRFTPFTGSIVMFILAHKKETILEILCSKLVKMG